MKTSLRALSGINTPKILGGKMRRVGVAGIIQSPGTHNFHILMGRRGKDPNKGLFVLPGGGVEDNETLEEAFCREVLEETGLEIEPTVGYSRWCHVYTIDLPDRVILVANAQVKKGDDTPKDGSDLYDVQWFDLLDLPLDISPVVLPPLALKGLRPGKRQ